MENDTNRRKQRQVQISGADLPLHCPLPSQPLWDAHPRVFLPLGEGGDALCPYCGTRYILQGAAKTGH
ncbi:MAG: zinc-finger domain-containing protein [Burkholderiales bacterium]